MPLRDHADVLEAGLGGHFEGFEARGQGVTVTLLKAAARYARGKGARILEGYPIDTKGGRAAGAFLWWGTWSAFKKAGFKEAARRSPGRPVARLELQ